MTITATVKNIVQYFTEGFLKIFSPSQDSYPATGIQPFGGTIPQYSNGLYW